LHIIGGVIVIGYFLLFGHKLWYKNPEYYTNRIECTGLYWHFVDLVWIFLFPTLYLL
jgi:heme/copper-type cytochrome/quinol oxidase subunit 3